MDSIKPITCDIFCDVIDNFGDAGVCWRLARDLTAHGYQVRLFINNLQTLATITGTVNAGLNDQFAENIRVCDWSLSMTSKPAKIVIETFGCRIPFEFEERIAKTRPTPIWINLEYLSAEDWVEGCHTLPSPHPLLGVKKYYFFPGVTEKTGGLIIENGLKQRQRCFAEKRCHWLTKHGADDKSCFTCFLFCYPQAPLTLLKEALIIDQRPVQILLSDSQASRDFQALMSDAPDYISVAQLPMVKQADFDELLWASDTAIIRGEDSFARAQIAGLPFIWNIYPQTEETHIKKLRAFADRLKPCYNEEDSRLWTEINLAWNLSNPEFVMLWPQWRNRIDSLRVSAQNWCNHLQKIGSLTENLCNFIDFRIKSHD